MRLRADGACPEETAARVTDAVSRLGAVVVSLDAQGDFIRLFLNYEGEVPELAGALYDMQEVEIHSMGRSSEVVKDVGTATDVDARHGLAIPAGDARHRARAAGDREHRRYQPRAPLLGLSRSRT